MSKSLFAALLLLPLAACSGHNAKPEVAAVPPVSATAPEADPTFEPAPVQPSMSASIEEDQAGATEATDLAFVEQMIPHHQAAVDMAKLAQQRSERAEIKELAANIVSEQEAEIAKMESWRKDWATDAVDEPGLGMHTPGMHPTDPTATGVSPRPDLTSTTPTGTATGLTPAPTPGLTPGATGSTADVDGEKDDLTASQDPAAPTDPTASRDDLTASQDDDDLELGSQDPTKSQDDLTASHDDPGAVVSKDLDALASAEDFDQAFLDAMIKHHEKGVAMARAASPTLEHSEAKSLADAIVSGQSEELAQLKAWREQWFPADVSSI